MQRLLVALNEHSRPPATLLHLGQVSGGERPSAQRFDQDRRRGDRVLDGEVDAHAAGG
ncbi:hypothetical protein [Nonomuraea sp. JJY05]|uniref:hypothetical protein n=1 Tax=Nonomuraea sp. JJY05 TaxID=3350255 RepID=UPI00373DEDEA